MIEESLEGPPPPIGHRQMAELRQKHRDRGAAAYADALSKLWLGNGTGAVVAVTALGAASGKLPLHRWFLLYPFCAFVLGLALLGVGVIATLAAEAKWLNAHEGAEGLLDLRVDLIQASANEIGLDWCNFRTVTAILAAVAFLAGILFGGAAVLQVLPI